MPTLPKKIVTPGQYVVNIPTKEGWKREKQAITPERIQHWVDQFQAMNKAGISIPAPWRHDLSIGALSDEQKKQLIEREKNEGSRLNAGFWENLFVDHDASLHGILDVPLDDDYQRVGKTVKETSIYTVPKYVDGNGNEWNDVIYHVALVTHPIETGQENFQRDTQEGKVELLPPVTSDVAEESFAVAMSQIVMSTEQPSIDGQTSVQGVVEVLKQFGLVLPNDTVLSNLVERITSIGPAVIAARSMSNSADPMASLKTGVESGKLYEPKKGFAMSQTEYKSVDPASPEGKALVGLQTRRITERLTGLVESGRISAEYVKQTVQPMLEGCAMSLTIDDEGNLGPTSVDHLLTALEAIPAAASLTGKKVKDKTGKVVVGGTAMNLEAPNGDDVEMTEEKAQEIATTVLKNVGYVK